MLQFLTSEEKPDSYIANKASKYASDTFSEKIKKKQSFYLNVFRHSIWRKNWFPWCRTWRLISISFTSWITAYDIFVFGTKFTIFLPSTTLLKPIMLSVRYVSKLNTETILSLEGSIFVFHQKVISSVICKLFFSYQNTTLNQKQVNFSISNFEIV